MKTKIVVLKDGWVLVGKIKNMTDRTIILDKANVIRIWGTSNGLGEIALNGPNPGKTILDKCNGEVECSIYSIIYTIDCNDEKWSNYL